MLKTTSKNRPADFSKHFFSYDELKIKKKKQVTCSSFFCKWALLIPNYRAFRYDLVSKLNCITHSVKTFCRAFVGTPRQGKARAF